MKITTAMIMAAGRGKRMGALGDELPKPLFQIQNKALINYVVDKIRDYGISNIVVNTCYKGDLIKEALNKNTDIRFIYSDEENALETGGGVKKALPLLLQNGGKDGFFVLNADTLWIEKNNSLMKRLADVWKPDEMDILLAILPTKVALGSQEKGNYFIEKGRLRRVRPDEPDAPYFFMSVQIMHPRVFENTPDIPFSSRDLFDKAQEKGRLSYVIHDDAWFNLNTPDALEIAQQRYQP